MRPTLPRSNRRRKSLAGPGVATRIAKGGRSGSAPAAGGPVAPTTEYVGRRGRRISASSRAAGSTFPRRRPSMPVRRAAFATLIVLSLALITASYRGGVVLNGAQLAVLEVVSPIERGLSRAWDPIAGAWNWTGRVITATNENPKLERENAELREQLRLAEELEIAYEKQRRSLGFRERGNYPRNLDWVAATVITRVPGAIERSLTIDVGTDAGVAVDDAVMVTGGLIGRVTHVTSDEAVVSLILDDAQRVSVSVGEEDAWGVLKTVSTEGTPVMQVSYVKQSAKVDLGDLVFTSGFRAGPLASIYPKGIPVGQVSDVGNDPADVNMTVQVEPFADFDRIEDVYVLAGGGEDAR